MHLNCHTYYSLRYGTLSPEQLVEEAVHKKADVLCLTDINNTSGMFDFVQACKKHHIKPLAGIEFRNDTGTSLQFIGIARNNKGFYELNKLLTHHSLQGTPIPDRAPVFDHAYVIYPRENRPALPLQEHEFIGIRPAEVTRLFGSPLKKMQHKLVILSPVTFTDKRGYKIHRLLRAIDNNTLLTKLTPQDTAANDEMMYSKDELQAKYRDYPAIIKNTEKLIASCRFDMDTALKNRKTYTRTHYDDKLLLEKLAKEGFYSRYDRHNQHAWERLLKELAIIDKLGFAAFFLITWDILRYAWSQGFHHVGRGSGANSIVAFCMRITDVDPIELDLYFERFLNPERTSPPDFDIDFSWDERDRVTDYVFKRYGRDYTALLGTYNTFNFKSIVREIGKTLGLPKNELDLIVKYPEDTSRHHGLAQSIIKSGRYLEKFPNYLSIHAGGILISEEPIYYYTALQSMPKGFPITHFDMHIAEDMGFYKYDVLSQRGLGHIKDAVDIIETNRRQKVDVHRVQEIKNDSKVKARLKNGSYMGCFYIESPAMRGLLRKLQCDDYLALVAASSVIRPGVAQSGMMREYISRTHHPDDFQYIHDTFRQHLGETFGVMVYQEDVIKISHHFAGLELGEADVLRRIMSGKRAKPGDLERIKEKYLRNCREYGYSEELIKEVWRQIESFSGYSFCKAHSASYAVESYQSLYLKTYFPLEFMVAVINNFGGFYNTEYYVHEAKMAGANIHAPCINNSKYLTCIKGRDIYLGFIHLQDLEQKTARLIAEARAQQGPFTSLENFMHRVPIGREQLEILIRIGALRFTGHSKQALMWEKNAIVGKQATTQQAGSLFQDTPTQPVTLPELEDHELEQAFDEIELLGFPLCSPFRLLRTQYRGDVKAKDLPQYTGKTVRMVGYYVCQKNLHTKNGRPMSFGTWLDDTGEFFDTTHFPNILKHSPFRGKGLYLIEGKVVPDFGFCTLDVERMAKLPVVADPRFG